jgi:WS/DGAT/MGAT family acyltransferase
MSGHAACAIRYRLAPSMLSSIAPVPLRSANRLTPQDARLLDLEERRGLPLHVASVLIFDGAAPAPSELTELVRARLDLVPRYRRRVVAVPWRQGRPVWADDPTLHLGYHLRVEALPGAADDAALARLAGRVLSQRLDRHKPLWEICMVEGLRPDRFALIVKSHEALVDGEHNLDIAGALLDDSATPATRPASGEVAAGPLPSRAQLLAGAVAERISNPREAVEVLRGLAARLREELERRDLDPLARLGAPPPSLLNRAIGPHRRLVWLDTALDPLRAAKERLRGTVNDLVLTAVAGAAGRYLRAHGEDVAGLVLRALVPVADARGEELLAAYAPLPVGIEDARRRHAEISRALDGLRDSGRAAGAGELVALDGFAPASMIAAAARMQTGQRSFNLMVTNVPGPQDARFLLGRTLRSIYPAVPLAPGQALSIAVISYAGRHCFGLLSDCDALADPELFAELLGESLDELAPFA